jgi:rhamnulokinase
LNYLFTGEKRSEFTITSTSQLLDPNTRRWSVDLLRRLELPANIFCDIVPPGTVIGSVTPAICGETGAKEIAVVAPACHDTGSAVAAVPAVGSDHAYISSGTWSLMGVESPVPVINELTMRYNFTNEGGVGGYRLLKNIMGLWLVQECRRTWAREGYEHTYDELTSMASSVSPLRSFVVPNDDCFVRPLNMPKEIRDFCRRTGQLVPDSKGEIIRCALESLAMTYRWTVEKLEEITGRQISVIHIVGGGTQNRLLCQLASDCMGRMVIAGPVEATAIGSIIVQAMATGAVGSLAEARQIIKNSFAVQEYTPDKGTAAAWDDIYSEFKSWM